MKGKKDFKIGKFQTIKMGQMILRGTSWITENWDITVNFYMDITWTRTIDYTNNMVLQN